MKQFTVKITYKTINNKTGASLNSKFTFDVSAFENSIYFLTNFLLQVPYFQRDTRLNFKFLDQFHADSKITSLYNCNFKISDDMPETLKDLAREIE